MSLWSNTDAATSAPKYAAAGGLGVSANGFTLHANTQLAAFKSGVALGVFGVDKTEAGITTGEGKKVQHAGWNLRKAGMGPITTLTLSSGRSGYNNGSGYLTFTGNTGTTSANASYTVHANGVIATVTLLSGGLYHSSPTITANGGSSATFAVTLGGRAGRVQYETLVAMGSMTSDATDDNQFPDS